MVSPIWSSASCSGPESSSQKLAWALSCCCSLRRNVGFNAIKLPFRDCIWTKKRRISGTIIGTIYYILSLGLLPKGLALIVNGCKSCAGIHMHTAKQTLTRIPENKHKRHTHTYIYIYVHTHRNKQIQHTPAFVNCNLNRFSIVLALLKVEAISKWPCPAEYQPSKPEPKDRFSHVRQHIPARMARLWKRQNKTRSSKPSPPTCLILL